MTEPDLYKVVRAEINPKTRQQALRISSPIKRIEDIPPCWSVIIGEVCHNLRSALDYLVCEVAILNTGNPRINTSFPIYRFGPRKQRAKGISRWPQSGVPVGIQHLKPSHIARIKRLQPYHRRNGQRFSRLWLLHELNNADKHRKIQVVASQLKGVSLGSGFSTETTIHRRGFSVKVGDVQVKTGMPLIDGTKVGTTDADTNMDMKFGLSPQIRFSYGCNVVKGLPVIHTLKTVADEVSGIIESFAPEF
ncbi:MAG: hypothetical protein ACE5JL_05900 [Dehalococcoidia bacterium]